MQALKHWLAQHPEGTELIRLRRQVRLRQVPFYQPCLILVLSGYKRFDGEHGYVQAEAGQGVALAAPQSLTVLNRPPAGGQYQALLLPFSYQQLQQLQQWYGLAVDRAPPVSMLPWQLDTALEQSLLHYLQAPAGVLRQHRWLEVLLLLLQQQPGILQLSYQQPSRSGGLRALLSEDLSKEWTLAQVCDRLATSESTLRRQLQREQTSFRQLLAELRLSAALNRLLQSEDPIYQVAADCGFQSVSRFSSNFRKRFGLPPSSMRQQQESGH